MWMRFSIDVVFLDESHKILRICENVKPFQFRMAPPGTCSVLELAAFNAKRVRLEVGEALAISHD